MNLLTLLLLTIPSLTSSFTSVHPQSLGSTNVVRGSTNPPTSPNRPLHHYYSPPPPSPTRYNVRNRHPTTLHTLPLIPSISIITSGLLAGSFHAVSGPDHLVSLLPRIMGQRWYKSIRVGAVWGAGHGISAMLLGALAFSLKVRLTSSPLLTSLLPRLSLLTESAVGLSLIVIGIMGLREAKEWKEELEDREGIQDLSSALPLTPTPSLRNRAIMLNGLLHGFSWDGAPSLAGGLAVKTWSSNVFFLLSYAIGTVAAMSFTTTVIGEGTVRLGERMESKMLSVRLSRWTSWIAVGVGVLWTAAGIWK